MREFVYLPVQRPLTLHEANLIGAIDAGECDAPVRVTWHWEVDSFKARILSVLEDRDLSVKACAGLPPAERQAWDTFTASTRRFLKQPTSVFGSYGEWVTTCGYSRYLDAWDVKLRKSGCKIIGPEDISSGDSQAVLKWVATGAIAIAAAAVLITYAPTLKAILPRSRP